MELQETLDHLNELGTAKIHQKTQIARVAIDAILNQDFTAISTIQYAGFLNIFQNELHMDMTSLKNALKEHNEQHNIGQTDEQLFVYSEKEQERKKFLYISTVAIIFVLILIFSFSTDSVDEEIEVPVSSAILEATIALETNTTSVDSNSSIAKFNPTEAKSDSLEANHPFIIYPKGDLWIGYIDLDTKVKKDTITNKPYALDENINMLLSLGHGQVKIVLNGETIDSDSTRHLRYIYKDGKLTKLRLSEFRELNEGNSW